MCSELNENLPKYSLFYTSTVIIVTTTMALFMYVNLLMGNIWSIPYMPNYSLITKLFILAVFLDLTPDFLFDILQKKMKKHSPSFFFNLNIFVLYVFSGLYIIGYLALKFNLTTNLLILIGIINIPLLLRHSIKAIKEFKHHKLLNALCIIMFQGLAGLVLMLEIWGNYSLSPFFLNGLITTGMAHQDNLFLVSLANMIKTYGHSSTGIDGIPFVGYHFVSHYLVVGLSYFLQTEPLFIYIYAYPLVFITLTIKTVIRTIADLKYENNSNFRIKFVWLFLALAIIVHSPFKILSESFLISIFFVMIFLSSYFSIFRKMYFDNALSKMDTIALLVFFPIFIGFILTLTKYSAGFFSIVLVLYLIIRFAQYRKPVMFITFILTILAFYTASRIGNYKLSTGNSLTFGPYFIYKFLGNTPSALKYYWRILSYPIIFILIRITHAGISSSSKLLNQFKERKILDIEFLMLLIIASLGVESFLNLKGNQYFAAYLPIITMIVLIANDAILKWLINKKRVFIEKQSFHVAAFFNATTIIIVFAIVIVIMNKVGISAKQYHEIVFDSQVSGKIDEAIFNDYRLIDYNQDAQRTWLDKLDELSRMPVAKKRKTAIFIPRDQTDFWDMCSYYYFTYQPFWSRAGSFVVPAVTGIALIDGLPTIIPYAIHKEYFFEGLKRLDRNDGEFINSLYISESNHFFLKKSLSEEDMNKAVKILKPLYSDSIHDRGYDVYPKPVLPIQRFNVDNFEPVTASAKSKGFSRVIVLRMENNMVMETILNIE